MEAFIPPPSHIPFYIRIGLWLARRAAGVDLLPPRLLAWYPKAAISSGILEALIAHGDAHGGAHGGAHGDGRCDERLLKLVRMTVSFTVVCPFCMGLNSAGWEKLLTEDELLALQGRKSLDETPTFTPQERLAIEYARLASQTPLAFTPEFGVRLREQFTEREIVILATTAAQVNYWARLIQALGCPPVG